MLKMQLNNELQVPKDFTTIQEAIEASEDGTEIIVGPGTYYENIVFSGKNICLRSSDPQDRGVVEKTVIDGGGKGACISLLSDETEVTIAGFTITNGSGQSAEGKEAMGGGIFGLVQDEKEVSYTITNNVFINNNANTGGAIFLNGGKHILKDNQMIDNQARFGGGISLIGGVHEVKNNHFSKNRAEGGGAITLMEGAHKLEENHVQENYATLNGGGICIIGGKHQLHNNFIQGNICERSGGGIILQGGSSSFQDNEISGNAAEAGGGMAFHEALGLAADNKIEDNNATLGGAIYIDRGSVAVRGNSLCRNWCRLSGGGLFITGGKHNIFKNTIEDNVATNNGADIYIISSSEEEKEIKIIMQENMIVNNRVEKEEEKEEEKGEK